jgi:hypothetical protein
VRYKLDKFSLEHPDLIDAKLTAVWGQELEELLKAKGVYGNKATMPEEEFLNYKYLIVVDGNSNPDRFPKLLESGSLVFRTFPIRGAETFSFRVKPWVHFIPIKEDLSDLADRIQWAKDHDHEAEIIARQSLDYIRSQTNAFLRGDAEEYTSVLLTKLSLVLRNYLNCPSAIQVMH